MTSLFDRLDEEEATIRGELETLREKIAAAEERLARLTITRDTLRSLAPYGADHDADASASKDHLPSLATSDEVARADRAAGDPKRQEPPSGPLDLETARKQMLTLLESAGRPMRVNDITAEIGEPSSRTETSRSRLKRLVAERLVIENPTGWFAIAGTPGSDDA
ncbi:hypothetical protein NLX86_20510 [Streptomyces sp. A3M-1-3]|uniref:hypothetical protein n=1 Tax=Streptomyces sp. A3M-1-3 TaxID=2962044 RepID=UPI0020B81F10|nr:hypothetical protein [Streptomyces sp. A3M-1-3]MCP3820391.1 hypothetical protein [Streptomyces sp. A3M-1-3]